MIISTTPTIEGRPIREYVGIVTGEVIVGGRAGAYEQTLREAQAEAFRELAAEAAERGADAVVAVDIDYEVVGANGSMLMVSASGTAVKLG